MSQESKQKKKFNELWNRVITLTQNENPDRIYKTDSSDVVNIFRELTEERNKVSREEFKNKLKDSLEAKIALDNSIKKAREELQKKEEREYEELNKVLSSIFSLLENTKKENEELLNMASGNFNDSDIKKPDSDEESIS